MVDASVHIYQDDRDGRLLGRTSVYFIDNSYSEFRNEFNMARFTEIKYNISDLVFEKWITTDEIVLFFKI